VEVDVAFRLNGREERRTVPVNRTLLDYLRDDLNLQGVNRSCDSGDCGCCIVLKDGDPVCSCLSLAVDVDGHEIVTIEGLSSGSNLHPVQRAFVDEWAVQCGFCTPGMVMSAVALLDHNPRPTEAEIRYALSANLCRCTGYAKIVKAVEKAAELMSGNDGVPS
jgi:carbon-monoxide dehydrogenase small subunit